MIEVYYNLKRIRNMCGLTQTELAAKVDVTRTFIANIEQGVRLPSLSKLSEIAKVLNVKPIEFFKDAPR